MTTLESGLVVNIIADRPETADLMRRNMDSLLREFANLGYDNPSFTFEGGRGDRQDNSPSDAAPRVASDTTDTIQPSLPTLARPMRGGLDLTL